MQRALGLPFAIVFGAGEEPLAMRVGLNQID